MEVLGGWFGVVQSTCQALYAVTVGAQTVANEIGEQQDQDQAGRRSRLGFYEKHNSRSIK